MKKGSSIEKFLLFLFFLASVAVLIYLLNQSLVTRKIDLEKTISYIKSKYTFAKIKVVSKKENTIAFSLGVINMDGSTIAEENFDMKGEDFFIGVKVVVLKKGDISRAFVFPYSVYTDEITPEDAINITNLYVKSGFPLNYYSSSRMDRDYIFTIKEMFRKGFGGETKTLVKGTEIIIMDVSVHPVSGLSIEGRNYEAIVHPNGGLEVE